jgi:hypothetical protein
VIRGTIRTSTQRAIGRRGQRVDAFVVQVGPDVPRNVFIVEKKVLLTKDELMKAKAQFRATEGRIRIADPWTPRRILFYENSSGRSSSRFWTNSG